MPSRKCETAPEMVTNSIARIAVPIAVWTGTPNTVVKMATIIPAPPAPMNPIRIPMRKVTVANSATVRRAWGSSVNEAVAGYRRCAPRR